MFQGVLLIFFRALAARAGSRVPPACPKVNGKVGKSHKTDSEEFYRGRSFLHKKIWLEN
jgi:hypothetical protein